MKLKNVLTVAIVLLTSVMASAQSFTVKGRLIDEKTGEPVEYVTVSVTRTGAADVVSYDQTNVKGEMTLKKVPRGKVVVKADLLGYESFSKEIEVEKDMDLGELKLKPSTIFLEGAVVTDLGNPIVVKKDTIEYTASSFKTMDNDMLEDLLKKLPGVEVSSTGTITANGKDVSKVKIDGKTFFLDDPQLASKNIPAKIIEKVKVIEEKSEQAKFTGIDDGEEETILDLSVSKGMMNGWFGNLMGGGGVDMQTVPEGKKFSDVNDARFQTGVMVARFSDKDQIAIIGNANNTNNRGFNDLAGSMMGGMRGGGGGMGMGGGGMNFRGSGISTSYMGGGNITHTFGKNDKSEVSGNYLFNGNEKYVEENSSKQTLQQDGSTLLSTENGKDFTNTYGHRAGVRLDWKISEQTSIMFTPQFNVGYGDFREESYTSTRNQAADGSITNVNDGEKLSTGENNSLRTSGDILIRQRLGKPGRTVSLRLNYSYSDNNIDGLNKSTTNYYQDGSVDTKIIDQNYIQNQKTYGLGGRLSYTEPLGHNFYAEATYRYDYSKTASEKNTYDKDANGNYTVKDERYSNNIENMNVNQRVGINIMKQEKKYNLTVGVNMQPSKTENVTVVNGKATTISNNVINWSPNARFDYDFSDTQMIRLRYNGRTGQPTVTQLQPVEDNSNPFNIRLGNPNLTPSFTHNLNTMFFSNNRETFSSINGNIGVTYKMNDIVNASWTDKGGVTYRVPMNNTKGSFSANARIMFNTPIAKSKFSIMNHGSVNYSNSMSFVGKEGIDGTKPESYLNMANYDENNYTTLSFSEMLRMTYRDDNVEVTLGGNTRYSKSWYQITDRNVGATWTNSVTGSVNWTLPASFAIATDGRYTFYNGYDEGFNDPVFVWNAELSKQLFKGMATLSLKAYDILNQSRNTYRTIADNYVQDVQNNTLGRYVMLSLTFRFGSFGGMRNGRGPMGPPPMGGQRGGHRR